MEPLLRVRDLKKHFPITGGFFGRKVAQVYAVDGVSFDVLPGQTLGVVGESGCGKSTMGRTILRLQEPTSGQIFFESRNILKLRGKELRQQRRDMQIVFQDPYSSLNPRMNVGAIIREPFIIHQLGSKKEREYKVDKLLDLVGLPTDAKTKYPHEFSGGQRQRIGIARAVALEPKFIVADEPVSALDVSVQSQVLNLLSELRERYRLSYLFIAHDLAVVEHISDLVAVMYLGRIVEYAPAERLYSSPQHPYTKALIEAIPVPTFNASRRNRSRKTLPGDVPSPISPPKGCHFHPRCPAATDICRMKEPPVVRVGAKGDHQVACHHV